MSLYLTTNCYYVLFSQQHLGKYTESWKWSVYRPFVGIPTTVAALGGAEEKNTLYINTDLSSGHMYYCNILYKMYTLFAV